MEQIVLQRSWRTACKKQVATRRWRLLWRSLARVPNSPGDTAQVANETASATCMRLAVREGRVLSAGVTREGWHGSSGTIRVERDMAEGYNYGVRLNACTFEA